MFYPKQIYYKVSIHTQQTDIPLVAKIMKEKMDYVFGVDAQKRHIRFPKVTSYGLYTRHSYGIYKEKVSSLNVLSVYTYIYVRVCMHVVVPASVTWLYETKRTEYTKSTRLALLCFALLVFTVSSLLYAMLQNEMKYYKRTYGQT